jgi:hypothetical protein
MPTKVPYPIRPTDSTLLSQLLTRHQINAAFKKGLLKAIGSYNKTVNAAYKKYEAACNKAADKLENDYKKLK